MRTVPIDQLGQAMAAEATELLDIFEKELKAEALGEVQEVAVEEATKHTITGRARYGLFPWRGRRPKARGHRGGPFPKPPRSEAERIGRAAERGEPVGLTFHAQDDRADYDYAGLFLEARYGILAAAERHLSRAAPTVTAKAARRAERIAK